MLHATFVKVPGFEHGGFFIWSKRLEQGLFASPLVSGQVSAREQSRHRLAVIAARMIDGDECASTNQLPALARDGDIGSGHGVSPPLVGMVRMSGAAPRSGVRASTGASEAPPLTGSAIGGGRFPSSGGTHGGVGTMAYRYGREGLTGSTRAPAGKELPGSSIRSAERGINCGGRKGSDGPVRRGRLNERRGPTGETARWTSTGGGGER